MLKSGKKLPSSGNLLPAGEKLPVNLLPAHSNNYEYSRVINQIENRVPAAASGTRCAFRISGSFC
jgi:hypothetical protein